MAIRITRVVHPKLSKELKIIETIVEKKSGYPIKYELWEELEGHSIGQSLFINRGPVVRMTREDMPIIAEELLHLKLRIDGYYMPRFADNEKGTKKEICQTQIANLLQHMIIFPFLEALSYRPREIKDQIIKDASNNWEIPCQDCEYCGMLYALYSLEASNEILVNSWKEIFKETRCLKARVVGEALILKIKAFNTYSPAHYRGCFEECLRILGIDGPFIYEVLPDRLFLDS